MEYMRNWQRKDVPSSDAWQNPRAIEDRYCKPDELETVRKAETMLSADLRVRHFVLWANVDELPLQMTLQTAWGDAHEFCYPNKLGNVTRAYNVPDHEGETRQMMHDIYMAGIETAIVIRLVAYALEKCGTPGELAYFWPNLLQIMQSDSTWGGHAGQWLSRGTTNKMEWNENMIAARNMANSVLLRASLLPTIDLDIKIAVDVQEAHREEWGFYVDWEGKRIVPETFF